MTTVEPFQDVIVHVPDNKSQVSSKIAIVNDQVRSRIIEQILQPNYFTMVENYSNGSIKWMNVGNFCEAGGKICLVTGGVVAFAAGFFNIPYLSFISGGISAVSTGLMIMSSYSFAQSSERTKQLDIVLTKLGISNIPDTVISEKN